MRQYLLCFFLLTIFADLFAQRNALFPIRQAHKWGMIDATAALRIPAKYDAIADQDFYKLFRRDTTTLRLRKILLDQKIGLVDYVGTEIIPPNFEDLRPFGRRFVAAQVDSFEVAYNLQNELVISTPYKKIAWLEDNYFAVQRNGLWGVHEGKGNCLVAPQFKKIKKVKRLRAKNYFFQASNQPDSKHWALYRKDGTMVLPEIFEKYLIINDRFLVAKREEQGFGAWDNEGKPILEEVWKGVHFIPEHFVKLTDEKNAKHLFILSQNALLDSEIAYTDFRKGRPGYVRSVKGKLVGLIDSVGREVLLPEYRAIEYAGLEDLYFVRKGKWAMFSVAKDSLLSRMEYDRISPFKENVAVIVKNRLFGLMNPQGEIVVAPEYTDYQREDNFVKFFKGNELTMFELDEEGNILSEEYYGETFTLKIGFDLVNGPDLTVDSSAVGGENIFVNGQGVRDYSLQQNSNLWWRENPKTRRWGLVNLETEETLIEPIYRNIGYVGSTDWTVAFNDSEYITCPLAKLTAHPFRALQSKAIFSHQQERFLTPFNIMGIRYEDFESGNPVASFIDENGRFGLIDKSAKELVDEQGEPLRFSYIGAFRLGKARVAIEGTIGKVKEQADEKLAFASITNFVNAYHLNGKERAYPNEELFVRAGKWGYLDTLGNLVIDAVYTYANNFEKDSLAINRIGEFWGVINEANETVLDFEYTSIQRFKNDRFKIAKKTSKSIFYNTMGKEIIGLKYDRFGRKSENLIRVKEDQYWGYVDELGNEKIPCQYDEAKNFQDGLAAVRQGQFWHFINSRGEVEVDLSGIAPKVKVKDVGYFKDGLAWFQAGDKFGYFDRQGNVRLAAKFKKAYDFCNGVAPVLTEKECGLIDQTGNYILQPGEYSYIGPFNVHGLAMIKEQYDGWVGLINTKGEIVAPIKYQQILPYKDGYAKATGMRGLGMLDATGKEVFPAIYGEIGAISEGMVAVRSSYRYTSHYVNLKHEKVFKGQQYDIAMPFSSGHAVIREDERNIETQFLINNQGEKVHPEWKDIIHAYSEGIYGVLKNQTAGSIASYYFANEDGENIFGRRSFMEIKAFKNSIAPVKDRYHWGAIGLHGLYLIPPKYSRITILPSGMIQARPGVIYGLSDRQGKILIPVAYDKLELTNKKRWLQIELGDRVGYADFNGEWIWELQR
ncbi:MAG: WG repeat-containing protein [Saprospiraceae bacterium]